MGPAPPHSYCRHRALQLLEQFVNCLERLDNLRKMSGILLDAGSKDDHNLHWGHRVLSHRLHEAGIAHEARENPGNHGGRARERYQGRCSGSRKCWITTDPGCVCGRGARRGGTRGARARRNWSRSDKAIPLEPACIWLKKQS
jgi:hypothetical protein